MFLHAALSFPVFVVLLHILKCLSPQSLYLLLPASKLELILALAPSSLLLLNNAGKLLSTGIFRLLDSYKSVYFSNIPDEPPNMSGTSSYRPNSGGIKETSQIQWPVPSINAELVDVFLGE